MSLAGDGKSEAAPLSFSAGYATRTKPDALNGFLPERFPNVVYMRDRPQPPDYAEILAVDEEGRPSFVISVRDIVEFLVDFFPDDVLNLPPDFGPPRSTRREGA